MSAGTIPASPDGSQLKEDSSSEDMRFLAACDAPDGSPLKEDSSSEDMRFLAACDALARGREAGSLRGSVPDVVGAPRDETTAVLAAPSRASSRRSLHASSSPRHSVSLCPSHEARRSCKRDFAMFDASPAEHNEALSLRQHRQRRDEVRSLEAHGTTSPCEVPFRSEAPVPGTSSQPERIQHSCDRSAHALTLHTLENGFHVERRAALQAEFQRLAEQQAVVVAALESVSRHQCSAVLSFSAALVDRAACPSFPSLRDDAHIAAHALRSALDGVASLMWDLHATTVCIQGLDRCLVILMSELDAMSVRIHALERSLAA